MGRAPVGTTRSGQFVLGIAGLTLGVGSGAGLLFWPNLFEPVLRMVLMAASWGLRGHLHYDPSQRPVFAGVAAAFGLFWFALMAYAFARQPARDRAIDAYLAQRETARSRTSTIDPAVDPRA
jgi:hypothetical protein